MKTGRKILRIIVLLAVLLTTLLPSMPVLAQDPPSSTPTVTIYVYRNLLETTGTGDRLYFWYANIPYAYTPTAPVTEAFIWQLIGTDNTTVLGSTVGYAASVTTAKGYGYNVYSLYFNASNVTALGMAWNTAYTLRLSGNPAVFSDIPIYNYPVSTSTYSTLSTTTDEQAELASRILITAVDLNLRWGLTSSTSLILEEESGTFLSQNGEAVFRGSIYGCQGLALTVFKFSPQTITSVARTWATAYSTNLSTQHSGTWVGDAQQAGADLMGATYDLTSLILVIILSFAVFFANLIISKKAGNMWSAFLDVIFLLCILGRLGLYELSFLGLIAALSWLYTSAKTWGLVN